MFFLLIHTFRCVIVVLRQMADFFLSAQKAKIPWRKQKKRQEQVYKEISILRRLETLYEKMNRNVRFVLLVEVYTECFGFYLLNKPKWSVLFFQYVSCCYFSYSPPQPKDRQAHATTYI